MSINAFGLIYTGEANAQLRELTFSRSVAAVPFGGRYRAIDFVLSNIVNSGITSVGLIAQRNYHSLMDHLGSGKEWDLHRKRDGLFILPPFVTKDNTGVYRGTVDAIRSVLGYVRRNSQRYVVLTGSHTIYNTDFDAMIRQHIETGADITIMYSDESGSDFDRSEQYDDLRLKVDADGKVTELTFNPLNPSTPLTGCDAYVMDKTLLEYLVEDAAAHGEYDFMQGVLIKNQQKFKFYGWRYDGYVARLNSVMQFYRHNMNLLKPDIAFDLFNPNHPIYTKVKDEVPARYIGGGNAKNSIVADGCIIEGDVENSILFRGVYIGKGARVRNSIVMQASIVNQGCDLDYMVLDKGCQVLGGRRLAGYDSYPMILRKGVVV